jgi:CheY-like chemotaxis protein
MPNETTTPLLLLVEDSEDDAFFFKRALKKSGSTCFIHHALDGGEAVEFLSRAGRAGGHQWPEKIFLDLKMPLMNGFEVLQWIRTQTFPREPEVIVLSGSDQQADKERAEKLGATGYLVKPITAATLQRHLLDLCPPLAEPEARP